MTNFIRTLLARRINLLLIFSFLLVSLIPVSVLGFKIYHAAWDNVWREINEKHRLLALNMAAPIQIYIEDKRRMMGILSQAIAQGLAQGASYQQLHQSLQSTSQFLEDFHTLALVDLKGNSQCIRTQSNPEQNPIIKYPIIYRDNVTFNKAIETQAWSISSVERSAISGNPTIIMAFPIKLANEIHSVLVAELKLDEIEKLRKNIHFGEKGHSAIVDNKGNALAHPNSKWMQEIKNLSHLKIVQRMLAGETGVTEFYSPFVKQTMVAGFTSVPELGWGIMVPQPKREVERQVNQLLFSQLTWGLMGLIIAIAIAIFIAKRITAPINNLANSAQRLLANKLEGELPQISATAPYEVRELNNALVNLISGLQNSRTEISNLNESLQDRIDEATLKLSVANIKLQNSAEDAVSANKTKSNFIASMSHELRTPLNAILGYSDLLMEEFDDLPKDIFVADLKKINKSGQHLLLLIDDILDISKIEAGKIELNLEEVKVSDLIKDIESIIIPMVKEKSNFIEFNNQLDLEFINTDKMKLKQILLNLLSNANKFTDKGQITVDVKHIKKDDSDTIEISVNDTGIGIKKDKLEKIFEAYSQADTYTAHNFGGTGLGLAISRHYARMMGGDITVTSIEGKSSKFTLILLANL